MAKPILCLDFDGVIHGYESGWQGADVANDPPVKHAMEFIELALKHFSVHVFSARSNTIDGRMCMMDYIEKHGSTELVKEINFPVHKPPAFVTIDDRAIMFTGLWPSMDELHNFKPWNKRNG